MQVKTLHSVVGSDIQWIIHKKEFFYYRPVDIYPELGLSVRIMLKPSMVFKSIFKVFSLVPEWADVRGQLAHLFPLLGT